MTSHNDILRSKAETSVRACADRIVKVWDRASDTQREDGAQWYPLARQTSLEMARDYGVTEQTAAAVIAALSPRIQWSRNVILADRFIAGRPGSGGLPNNYAAAQRALDSDDPAESLRGPKVRSFCANILGDLDAVTIDVWATRIALHRRIDDVTAEKYLGRTGVYDALAHSYRVASARVGVTPSTMQATTWVVGRGRSV